jgi:hypothetical protein
MFMVPCIIKLYIYIYMSNLMSFKLLLFYLINLYMFRAFLAHHQEILFCLVSRYGKL